jgi:hypothetical protein
MAYFRQEDLRARSTTRWIGLLAPRTCLTSGACLRLRRTRGYGSTARRLHRAFRSVDVAVNHLKVWQTPKIEQLRPWKVPVLAPNPKQRDAVVNFCIPPQPTSTLSAAATLEAPQESDLDTWRIPELPGHHAGAVPDRVLVGTTAPEVDVPAEAINWLTAHAAKSRPERVRLYTERCGWCCQLSSLVTAV